jgi:hypothetical protein
METQATRKTAALVVITAILVTVGSFAGAVGAQHTEGNIKIGIEGTATPGDTVTVNATLNGDAVVNGTVAVNDEYVGTTDADGRLNVTVPNASTLSIRVESDDAFGVLEGSLTEDGFTTEHDTDDNDTTIPDNTTDDNDTTIPDNTTDDNTTEDSGSAGAPPAELASFSNTTSPGSVSPPSLSGKLRVESAVADNVSVELLRETQTNYSLAITAPGSATNVTFYLQSQAVESSQNIQNVTMYLDGERQSFYVDSSAGPGNSPWIAFQIDHFSTRTVSFSSQTTTNSTDTVPTVVGDTPAQDLDGDGTYEDVNGDGTFNIVDVNAFFANRQSSSVQNNPGLFDFNGDGVADIVDVSRLFSEL